jgi:hypothetical protein
MIEQIARRHENMICGFYPAEYAPNDIATLLRIARAAKELWDNRCVGTCNEVAGMHFEAPSYLWRRLDAALKGDGDK